MCGECHDTGKVYWLSLDGGKTPMLGVKCEGDDWADCWDGKATAHNLKGHRSDCARHNMPTSPNGPCDCGLWPDCGACNGTGWRPISENGAQLAALLAWLKWAVENFAYQDIAIEVADAVGPVYNLTLAALVAAVCEGAP